MFFGKKKIQSDIGIDLMEAVQIGGISQTIYFRGEDRSNPVVFFIHGGPGQPEMPFLHEYQYAWEKQVTVVHWDQRNTGKTFYQNVSDKVVQTLDFDVVLSDATEVAAYIRNKLNVKKLIVIGHSWGTVLGMALVQAIPEFVQAYVGFGQIVNMRENEQLAFESLQKTVLEKGKVRDIEKLKQASPYPPDAPVEENFLENLMVIKRLQAEYGLAESFGIKMLATLFSSPYYTWGEKRYFFQDIQKHQLPLLTYLYEKSDVRNFGLSFSFPIIIIMGAEDRISSPWLAEQYAYSINAPYIRFYSISDTGHFSWREKKDEVNQILKEELSRLSDSNK